jgi:phosphocarrier protein HPr
MAQRTLRFASGASVNARPAALFSQAAAGSGVPVRIAKGDSSPGDAASILQVVVPGQRRQVTVFTDGPQADGAAVAVPERPTTATGRTPAVLLDVDQLLISTCRALHSSARTVCWLAGREQFNDDPRRLLVQHIWHICGAPCVACRRKNDAMQPVDRAAPSHGHLFHDAEVVLFGPHRPGQHGEFRSRAAAFGRQVGSLSDDPCACRTARRF